jgi:hypothetical protein
MRGVASVAVGGALLVLTIAALIGRCEYSNSRKVSFPPDAEIRVSLSRASAWIFGHSAQLLSEDNPMLWLFVRDAGRAADEPRLLALAGEYQSQHIDSSIWRYIFDSTGRGRTAGLHINFPDGTPDYNRLFIYGATCNESAHEDPAVLMLLNPAACDPGLAWLRSPWCRTHQLMGLRFVQKNHCESDAATAETVAAVQSLILSELAWDFRVEDAYIQKVLMLVESGRRKDVKAVWLRKILEAQRADGGWDGVDVIAHLPGNRVLCWTNGHLYPRITRQRSSNFHATAQGLYLLALWLGREEPV